MTVSREEFEELQRRLEALESAPAVGTAKDLSGAQRPRDDFAFPVKGD